MSLHYVEKSVSIAELDDASFGQFRIEVFGQFFSVPCPVCGQASKRGSVECGQCHALLQPTKIKGIIFAKDAIDALRKNKALPVTSREFTDYAKLIEAGCNALPRLMDELRDEFARDVDGEKIEGEDGDWLKKTPLVVFPITAKYGQAWGSHNRAEGFALAEAMPAKYVEVHKLRQKLINGQQAAQVKRIDAIRVSIKAGTVDTPALLALLDEFQPDDAPVLLGMGDGDGKPGDGQP